jgi:hypothetical protein
MEPAPQAAPQGTREMRLRVGPWETGASIARKGLAWGLGATYPVEARVAEMPQPRPAWEKQPAALAARTAGAPVALRA